MFIQARALTTIYRKGVASLGPSATRWTVSVAYPTYIPLKPMSKETLFVAYVSIKRAETEYGRPNVCLLVGWLLNVPATG